MGVETLLLLFSIATLVALFTRALKVPYTVALVLTGLGLGALPRFPTVPLTRDLVFSVFLPLLIFEAAYHLDARRFWEDRLAINALATPGLVVALFLTAGVLVWAVAGLGLVSSFGFIHGVVFASIIGATDPIAVVALFRSLGAPPRLQVLVEGESLVNDGTGIVVFGIAVAVALGGSSSPTIVAVSFLRVAGLGILVGLAVGLALLQVVRRASDALIEISITVVAAFGSFLLAERLQASGVISTLVAGLLLQRHRTTSVDRRAVQSFWEFVAFALNSVVFLLVGLEVRVGALLESWKPILAAYVAMTLARVVMVHVTALLLRRTARRLPHGWAAVLSWSGLRGALSMVLVLSLPAAFAHRELMVRMTFGVVLLTILLQGMTMKRLLEALGLVDRSAQVPAAEG